MVLPVGVTTATVIAGVPVTHTGAPVKAFVSIEPSAYLVHAATGTPLVDFLEELDISEGVAGQFVLPHTDQAGFIDDSGNAYTNWYYTARVTYSTPSKAKTKAPKVKVFQLTTGQTTVDLDLLPAGAPALPYIAPTATVTAFEGRTGPIALEESDLPERLSDTSLSATFASTPTPTPPANPVVGQTWYSSAMKHLRVPASVAERPVVFSKTGTWEGEALQEPSVWIADGKYQALFSAGAGLGYASCPLTADPTVAANWTRPATYTGPVVSGAKHASTYVENGTIHLYYIDLATSTKVMYSSASTGSPFTWSTGVQVMSLPAGSSVFGNTRVVKDDDGTYVMIIEHKIAATGRWQMGQATAATLGGAWTMVPGVEVMDTLWPETDRQGSGGAWLAKENGEWVMYYHASVNWNGLVPSEIYRATAPALRANNWTITNQKEPIIRRVAPHEVDQVADVELIRAPDGTVYAFWVGMHNRGAAFKGSISIAVLRPTMLRWDGYTWQPMEGQLERGKASTDPTRPRTAMLVADFSGTTTDAWFDVPGLSLTHPVAGTDVEIEVRGIFAPTGSSGYKYKLQAVQGSTVIPLGGFAGTVGVPTSFVGVAKFTQLTLGFKPFKVQAFIPAGGGTLHCRPLGQAGIEYSVIKATDVTYP
jgi:hypothetical protein